jgi:hypothetical protein
VQHVALHAEEACRAEERQIEQLGDTRPGASGAAVARLITDEDQVVRTFAFDRGDEDP